jgi:ribosome maturation factor RimP
MCMEDRRLHPRIPISSTVLLKNENFVRAADVLDISSSGMRVCWKGTSAREGAKLELTLGLTSNHFRTYSAEIVRVNNNDVGLRFQNALPEDVLEAAVRLATASQ